MRSTPKFVRNLVFFIVLVIAVLHVIGEWGLALPFVYPLGTEVK